MLNRVARPMVFHRRLWTFLGLVTVLVSFCLTTLTACLPLVTPDGKGDEELLEAIYEEIIPHTGTETGYGIPLDLGNLPMFIDWFYEIDLGSEEQKVFHDALIALVAPCCDDNTMFRCCCEKGERACNLVRSGKGLASYLIHGKGYTAEEIREAVLQWLQFARPDYYVARELEARGIDPRQYDLTTYGSCYRQLCQVSISQGGCGGMEDLIEPAIQHNDI